MIVELLLLMVVVVLGYQIFKKPDRYPPGLWGLPLFGSVVPLFKNTNLEEFLKKEQKKSGDVFLWRVGTKINVFLFNYRMIKENYNKMEFANRPDLSVVTFIHSGKNTGIITSNGVIWHNNRRFALRHLRDLGMGKSRLVESVQHEATELVSELKKSAGKAQRPPKILIAAVINVIWQMVASHRCDYDDRDLKEFIVLVEGANDSVNNIAVTSFFPWIESIVPQSVLRKILKVEPAERFRVLVLNFMKEFVDQHKLKIDYDNPKDFIDEYLTEIKKKDKKDELHDMTDDDLVHCIADIFNAGTGTTSVTITWAMLYLAKFPEVQEKLQKEIDEVLPKGVLASLQDKPRLNYTEAFIHETHRYASLLHSGVVHSVNQDTEIGGYIIPKGAIIYSMAGYCHFNDKFWKNPEQFQPERFLDSEEKFVNPTDGFLPFGIGKRQCMGEAMARMELLIFLTALVQSFSFKPAHGKPIDIKPISNFFTNLPNESQEIMIELR